MHPNARWRELSINCSSNKKPSSSSPSTVTTVWEGGVRHGTPGTPCSEAGQGVVYLGLGCRSSRPAPGGREFSGSPWAAAGGVHAGLTLPRPCPPVSSPPLGQPHSAGEKATNLRPQVLSSQLSHLGRRPKKTKALCLFSKPEPEAIPVRLCLGPAPAPGSGSVRGCPPSWPHSAVTFA